MDDTSPIDGSVEYGAVYANDDDYANDDGFVSYVPTTIDPGMAVLVATVIYCFIIMILLPVLVSSGRKRHTRKMALENSNYGDRPVMSIGDRLVTGVETAQCRTGDDLGDLHSSVSISDISDILESNKTTSVPDQTDTKKYLSDLESGKGTLEMLCQRSTNSDSNMPPAVNPKFSNMVLIDRFALRPVRILIGDRLVAGVETALCRTDDATGDLHSSASISESPRSVSDHLESGKGKLEMVCQRLTYSDSNMPLAVNPKSSDEMNQENNMVLIDRDALKPVRILFGKGAIFSVTSLIEGFKYLLVLSERDDETKKIIGLAAPMTTGILAAAIFEIVDAIIISRFLGIRAFTAFTLVQALLELSDSLLKGFVDTINTVCAHAIGNKNSYLAGQYVQIACFLYVMLSMPVIMVWCQYTDSAILLLTDNQRISNMAMELVQWLSWFTMLEGLDEALGSLLDVTEHEIFNAIMDILDGALSSLAIFLAFQYIRADLATVGIIYVVTGVLKLFISLAIAYCKGWLDPFKEGMFQNVALKNIPAVSHIIRTGIPLAVGEFLGYAEWEFLLIFAAILGEAEVAVWGMLGTVWEVLEATTEGISEAAGIRIALHLGKGRPALAKTSAHKSLYFSMILGFFMTSILYLLSANLPIWFTDVIIIQNLISEVIYLLGSGNLFLVTGMTAWGVLGGQGRFHLATITLLVCSWGVTLPLCAISTYYKINLIGQVGGVVAGYATAAMTLVYFVQTSDWDALSAQVIKQNKATEDSLSVSSANQSSSSSLLAEVKKRGPKFDEDDDWDELETVIQEAAMVLGYTKRMWDKGRSPATEEKDFVELSPEEKEAAEFLGYDVDWDDK
eukprot:CAMPEP_0194347102 /NCGR_PEP_ID=MMETSP0171-20130528/105801_1 /TAXON_ID=218684 /ORGANISM="Corethron pennatum, Strain L29A3" /LENGTH=848 /DNA_ID=CAMNT_0039114311 /DNA_START=138 /DNA_END=2684 /DNA_ORIENTATION=+